MIIIVNGSALDVPKQEISLHFNTMYFSDALDASYSTDIELPLTGNNIRLLDVWSVADRDGQLFGNFIEADVLVAGKTYNGKLQIGAIKRDTVTITVYFGGTADALLSKPLNRVLDDDANSIYNWRAQRWEMTADPSQTVHFTAFDDGKGAGIMIQPNIALNYLFQQITDNTNVVLPTFSSNYRLLCTRRKLCPHNTKQLQMWNITGTPTLIPLVLGQHICNEIDEEGNFQIITFNRACTVDFYLQMRTDVIMTSGGSVSAERSTGGGAFQAFATLPENTQAGGVDVVQITVPITAGDKVRFINNVAGAFQGKLAVGMTITNYDIDEEDYNVELDYDTTLDYTVPSWVQGGFGYLYFGIYNNLPTVTLSELVKSLAWKSGKILYLENGNLVANTTPRSEYITARIEALTPFDNALGQLNVWKSTNEKYFAEFKIPNELLEEEKVIHQSAFYKTAPKVQLSIPLYSQEGDAGNYTFNEIEGAVISTYSTYEIAGRVWLLTDNTYTTLGLSELTRVVAVEGMTDADLTELEIVYIQGHKVFLSEFDLDESSGLSTFKGFFV